MKSNHPFPDIPVVVLGYVFFFGSLHSRIIARKNNNCNCRNNIYSLFRLVSLEIPKGKHNHW